MKKMNLHKFLTSRAGYKNILTSIQQALKGAIAKIEEKRKTKILTIKAILSNSLDTGCGEVFSIKKIIPFHILNRDLS